VEQQRRFRRQNEIDRVRSPERQADKLGDDVDEEVSVIGFAAHRAVGRLLRPLREDGFLQRWIEVGEIYSGSPPVISCASAEPCDCRFRGI
jgi:hypothetical protein